MFCQSDHKPVCLGLKSSYSQIYLNVSILQLVLLLYQQFPHAPMPPPPVPVNSSDVSHDNDALASMLMAWYLSGYHTGYYQVSE